MKTLNFQKETLRSLVSSDLQAVNGGYNEQVQSDHSHYDIIRRPNGGVFFPNWPNAAGGMGWSAPP
jgi:hypothetical protein